MPQRRALREPPGRALALRPAVLFLAPSVGAMPHPTRCVARFCSRWRALPCSCRRRVVHERRDRRPRRASRPTTARRRSPSAAAPALSHVDGPSRARTEPPKSPRRLASTFCTFRPSDGVGRRRRQKAGTARLTPRPELQRTALGLMSAHHLPEAAIVADGRRDGEAARLREPRRERAAAGSLRRGDGALGERLQGRHGCRCSSRTHTSAPTRSSATRAASSASTPPTWSTTPSAIAGARRSAAPGAKHQHRLRAPREAAPRAATARGDGAPLRVRASRCRSTCRCSRAVCTSPPSRWSSRERRPASGTRRCRRSRRPRSARSWRAAAKRCGPASSTRSSSPDGRVHVDGPRDRCQRTAWCRARPPAQLATMMEHTVARGHELARVPRPPRRRVPAGRHVAGKTGTLTDAETQRYYTWFTGFAPADPPPPAPAGRRRGAGRQRADLAGEGQRHRARRAPRVLRRAGQRRASRGRA